jgi:hypothetical protein
MEPKTTEITDEFDMDDYRARYPERLVLFLTDKRGSPRFPLDAEEQGARPGWKITALAPVDNEKGRTID